MPLSLITPATPQTSQGFPPPLAPMVSCPVCAVLFLCAFLVSVTVWSLEQLAIFWLSLLQSKRYIWLRLPAPLEVKRGHKIFFGQCYWAEVTHVTSRGTWRARMCFTVFFVPRWPGGSRQWLVQQPGSQSEETDSVERNTQPTYDEHMVKTTKKPVSFLQPLSSGACLLLQQKLTQ